MLVVALLIIGSAAVSEGFAQMVAGEKIPEYEEVFGVKFGIRQPHFTAHMIAGSVPGNVLYPGDQPSFTVQIINNLDQPIKQAGKVDVIEYGTRGRPGDIWKR